MIGLVLIGSAVMTALLAATALRLQSLVSTLLVAYLALVANLGLVTLVLSPFREVTRGGLAVAESLLLMAAVAGWWLRGRPRLPLAPARPAISQILCSPLTALFLVVVVGVLAYELVLALTVPANNWDSLTYHLARVAAWAQHGGIYWISNAPTDRLNEFQPFAEQQILFLFVATGGGALFALPQFLAELAILVAVYGASRRLGFEVRAAACAAFLLATFSLVALEATTAQNDLVAASFPVVAACLLLGGGGIEAALAGAAVGIGLGAKLTTLLVLPVVAWLAVTRGRRTVALAIAGALIGFAAIGMWGYALNVSNTGHVLGHGQGRVEATTSPSYPGSVLTGIDVLYATMDLSALSDGLIRLLTLAGLLAAAAAAALRLPDWSKPPGAPGRGAGRDPLRGSAVRDRGRRRAGVRRTPLGRSRARSRRLHRGPDAESERGLLGLRPGRRGDAARHLRFSPRARICADGSTCATSRLPRRCRFFWSRSRSRRDGTSS